MASAECCGELTRPSQVVLTARPSQVVLTARPLFFVSTTVDASSNNTSESVDGGISSVLESGNNVATSKLRFASTSNRLHGFASKVSVAACAAAAADAAVA